MDLEDLKLHLRRSLATPVIYLVAIGLSFLSTALSVVVYVLVPVVYGTLPSIYARRKGPRRRES